MMDRQERFKALMERIQRTDSRLHDEIQANQPAATATRRVEESVGGAAVAPAAIPQITLETIVRKTGRPVLQVFHDEPKLDFADAESRVWGDRLKAARTPLVRAIRAVGRIELSNHPDFEWVGTGWLVKPDIVVTNRHVAQTFGRKRGDTFVFKSSFLGPISANIDFLEEFDNFDSNEMVLKEILHIEDEDGPDYAFLRVEPKAGNLAAPIDLNLKPINPDQFVAVIGYPARDSRIPEQDVMLRIFGDVFDKKRLAPGQLMDPVNGLLQHDCSTLGGNSGSVVLDLNSGQAVGLHFAGTYLTANFAVPAQRIAEQLDKLSRPAHVVAPAPAPVARPESSQAVAAAPQSPTVQPVQPVIAAPTGTASISCVIPIRLNIEIGGPQLAVTAQAQPAIQAPAPAQSVGGVLDAEESEIITEAPPRDYSNRKGFDEDFLGNGLRVPMPAVEREKLEVVEFQENGKSSSVLKYQHFSVVMHRTRRMCFFSAVNIDGKLSKRTVRGGWLFDTRIPSSLQIKGECYGNPPKYSRGHMTRREDPAWGPSQADADLGCNDSMHVTNTTPQMQSFNGGVWLSLEDYALQHARKDSQRICVITGPIFTKQDPTQFGIRIPKAFFKVIAFVHDETGKLTATGYSISQEDHIPNTEFVFGQFGTHQRSLNWIESKTGLSFGALSKHDPKNTVTEAMESESRPLGVLEEIQF